MGRAEKILNTIEQLYEAVLEPDCWTNATKAVADTTSSHHVLFFSVKPQQGVLDFHAVFGIDPDDLTPFRTAVIEGRIPAWFHSIPVGFTQNSSDVEHDRDFLRSAFYNEALRPHGGGFYGAVTPLLRKPDRLTIFTVCRVLGASSYSQDEINLLQTITPHLTAALRMRERVGQANLRAATALAVLDQLNTGIILLDAAMRPVFVNARAESIAAQGDGILINGAQVLATVPQEALTLRQSIANAVALAAGRGDAEELIGAQKPSRFTLSRKEKRPLLAAVIPIWSDNAWAGTSACAALFIDEPDRTGEVNAEVLARTYGLAPREAELALRLGQGKDLAMAAQDLGIGIGTARWYLKRIQEKTDTHRQAELMRLLTGFAKPDLA